jgi:hypothetical protein
VDLVPGRRYDVSAAALSENSAQSTKILRSLALEPGFDFKAFGLNIQVCPTSLLISYNLLLGSQRYAQVRMANKRDKIGEGAPTVACHCRERINAARQSGFG